MDAEDIVAALTQFESTTDAKLGEVDGTLDDVVRLLKRILSVLENIERKR